ncbi:hypothetical protein OAO01_06160 [Oligoflexia bacterium]|nr:hypothetical protein [Oligoflexia bacterium]
MGACYECGSPEGESFRLCPECIENKQSARTQRYDSFREQQHAQESDRIVSVTSSLWAKIAAGMLCTIIFFLYYLYYGPFKDKDLLTNLLLAFVGSFYIMCLFTWVLLWVEIIVNDILWAIGICIIPLLLYLYIALHPGKARFVFVLHLIFLGLALSFTYFTAQHLEIHFLKVWIIFYFHLRGIEVDLSELKFSTAE